METTEALARDVLVSWGLHAKGTPEENEIENNGTTTTTTTTERTRTRTKSFLKQLEEHWNRPWDVDKVVDKDNEHGNRFMTLTRLVCHMLSVEENDNNNHSNDHDRDNDHEMDVEMESGTDGDLAIRGIQLLDGWLDRKVAMVGVGVGVAVGVPVEEELMDALVTCLGRNRRGMKRNANDNVREVREGTIQLRMEGVMGRLYESCRSSMRKQAKDGNRIVSVSVSSRTYLAGKLVSFLTEFEWNVRTGSVGGMSMTTSRSNVAGRGMQQEHPLAQRAQGVETSLWVLHRILLGLPPSQPQQQQQQPLLQQQQQQLPQEYRLRHLEDNLESLLRTVLLPLHAPDDMVLWRDQTALLGLYHEPLVLCLLQICRRPSDVSVQTARLDVVVTELLSPTLWPHESRGRANTPKVILLLHEVDLLMERLLWPLLNNHNVHNNIENNDDDHIHLQCLVPLVHRLCSCIASDNSRTSERALQYWKSRAFPRLLRRPSTLRVCLTPLLEALCRGLGAPAWNPTVNRMTLTVLETLQSWDPRRFAESAETLYGAKTTTAAAISGSAAAASGSATAATKGTNRNVKSNHRLGKGGQIRMHHPRGLSGLGRGPMSAIAGGAQPPLTITGVAPWANVTGASPSFHWKPNTSNTSNSSSSSSSMTTSSSRGNPTKSTVTMRRPGSLLPPRKKPHPQVGNHNDNADDNDHDDDDNAEDDDNDSNDNADGDDNAEDVNGRKEASGSGLEAVHRHMAKLRPSPMKRPEEDWSAIQLQESPMLLPELKFHELVFRHDPPLGKGAFSTVYYAQRVLPDRTRSEWPEYAVKVVAAPFICQRYEIKKHSPDNPVHEHSHQTKLTEAALAKEVAVLSAMVHPNVARLVSSFRYRSTGAYLVMEYASGGDLFGRLVRSSDAQPSEQIAPLDHDSTRFVAGEIVAALASIHQAGFVYGDLKPENILFTNNGHVKVADFGACRAVDSVALATLRSKRQFLRQMRDGDWRQRQPNDNDNNNDNNHHNNDDDNNDDNDDFEVDDGYVQGTIAYIPPEVAMGELPTKAADVWALGCVLYQCLRGRPPILEETDQQTRQTIVNFTSTHVDVFQNDDNHDNNNDDNNNDNNNNLPKIRPSARRLIDLTMSRSSLDRPEMANGVAHHEFFEGVDVFSLYQFPAPKLRSSLTGSTVAPSSSSSSSTDPRWTRRQFSAIWAPQPRNYGASSSSSSSSSLSSSTNAKEHKATDTISLRNRPIDAGIEVEDPHFLLTRSQRKTKRTNATMTTTPTMTTVTTVTTTSTAVTTTTTTTGRPPRLPPRPISRAGLASSMIPILEECGNGNGNDNDEEDTDQDQDMGDETD